MALLPVSRLIQTWSVSDRPATCLGYRAWVSLAASKPPVAASGPKRIR